MIKLFEPSAKSIREVFDGSVYYHVPDYQRPYSWESEQIEELWDDIFQAFEEKSNNEKLQSGKPSQYFLGSIILIDKRESQPGEFEVVDGQQRLTTIQILFCVLRDLYFNNEKKIAGRIKNIESEKFRLRFTSQVNEQNQFEDQILNKVRFPPENLSEIEREKLDKFQNAAYIFREKTSQVPLEQLVAFTDYLLDQVQVITITCADQDSAIRLFQVLNTRGLELTPADLIKSHLMGSLDSQRRGQFVATWRELENKAKDIDESLTDLFTYYLHYSTASNPKRELYEELLELFKKKRKDNPELDSNAIISEFKKLVDAIAELKDSKSKRIFALNYLLSPYWKTILATAKLRGVSDIEPIAFELRRFYFLYALAGYTNSAVKQSSFNFIKGIKEGKDALSLRQEIDDKMDKDQVVLRANQSLLSPDFYSNKWATDILALIEYQQTDDSNSNFIELNKTLHVEHICPVNNQKVPYWKSRFEFETSNKLLNSIGNLTLLSGKKNIKASDKPFPDKRAIYEGKGIDGLTGFVITQSLTKEQDWTPQQIVSRRSWLFEQLNTIFDIELDTELREVKMKSEIAALTSIPKGWEKYDTIVCPMHEDGFQEFFIKANEWHAIRLRSSIITHFKWIAAYRTSPESAITHIAPIKEIVPYKDTGKCQVNFSEPAKPIGPIKNEKDSQGRLAGFQGPRFAVYAELIKAKNLQEAFS